MAIDTAEKRFSMMGLANPSLTVPVPTGSVNAAKRAVFLYVYSGIALGGAPLANTMTGSLMMMGVGY
jgi:hypothetical protein